MSKETSLHKASRALQKFSGLSYQQANTLLSSKQPWPDFDDLTSIQEYVISGTKYGMYCTCLPFSFQGRIPRRHSQEQLYKVSSPTVAFSSDQVIRQDIAQTMEDAVTKATTKALQAREILNSISTDLSSGHPAVFAGYTNIHTNIAQDVQKAVYNAIDGSTSKRPYRPWLDITRSTRSVLLATHTSEAGFLRFSPSYLYKDALLLDIAVAYSEKVPPGELWAFIPGSSIYPTLPAPTLHS